MNAQSSFTLAVPDPWEVFMNLHLRVTTRKIKKKQSRDDTVIVRRSITQIGPTKQDRLFDVRDKTGRRLKPAYKICNHF